MDETNNLYFYNLEIKQYFLMIFTKHHADLLSFKERITKYPVKATLVYGVITSVEHDERDPTQLVNLKKGILSSLQVLPPVNASLTTTLLEVTMSKGNELCS